MNKIGLGKNLWSQPDDAAAQEYLDYAQAIDLQATKQQFDAVTKGSAEFAAPAQSAARWSIVLSERIRSRVPGSFIRLGDGEGNVMFAGMGLYPHLTEYCIQLISRMHFGSPDVVSRNLDFFVGEMVEATFGADGVGGPDWNSVAAGFQTPIEDLDVRGRCGMRGVYNYLASRQDLSRLSNSLWTSTWVVRGLLPYFAVILKSLPFLCVISPYEELAGMLAKEHCIDKHETILVPLQATTARSMNKDTGHYPEGYHRITSSIRPPFPGAVYIVAAGLLAKSYCRVIKLRGGIAIDVGHIADVWMGVRSRPGVDDAFIDKWRLSR